MELGGFMRAHGFFGRRVAVRGYRVLRSIASALGFQVVLKTFYSPIPELDRLPPGAFARRSALTGLDFDLDRQLRFVEERLAEPIAEFRPPASAELGSDRYVSENPSYGPVDAAVLYGMVRHLRPARVMELGSGHSTLVMAQAALANAQAGAPVRLEAYDPFAAVVSDGLPGLTKLHRVPVQDVPLEVFDELGAGDVLFVDTTHTVKIGSDVNFVVLDVLPRLAPGVVVHFHDIFLPYEYPRNWLDDYALYWNEQYLVQAFLSLNREFEVLCAVAALASDRRDRLARALPPGVADIQGGALWIRRTG
jgi:hypothetical protein